MTGAGATPGGSEPASPAAPARYAASNTATAATATDLRPVYESSHQRWDANVRWQINPTYQLELTGSNLTNDSWRNFYQGGRNTSRRTFGTNYLLTFRANLDQIRLPFVGP